MCLFRVYIIVDFFTKLYNIYYCESNNKKIIFMASLKVKLKNCSKKDKFFGILSHVTSEDVDETTMLSDIVKDLDVLNDKPIMACDFAHDLGLDSLDVLEMCFQCKEVFGIDEEIDVEMDTVTVQELYDIVNKHGKGD